MIIKDGWAGVPNDYNGSAQKFSSKSLAVTFNLQTTVLNLAPISKFSIKPFPLGGTKATIFNINTIKEGWAGNQVLVCVL